jgi:hypothetical protein
MYSIKGTLRKATKIANKIRGSSATKKASLLVVANCPNVGIWKLQNTVGNRVVQRLLDSDRSRERNNIRLSSSVDLSARIQSMKIAGQSLDLLTRSYFQRRMGFDLSKVKVHTTAAANDTVQKLSARAFTFGENIFFGAGQYKPNTPFGRRLLAHELTHVIQQSKLLSPRIQRQAIGSLTWNKPTLNRRNAAKIFYYSKALMGTPAGQTTLVVNGKIINSNHDLMSAIPQPAIDSKLNADGSSQCWFKSPVNATANTRLDILTKPPWKFILSTSDVAKKYTYSTQCKGKTGTTEIRTRDWYKKDAKLEKLIHQGELEHNNAAKKAMKKYVKKYIENVNKHLGAKKALTFKKSPATKSVDCAAELRKVTNYQLLTDAISAYNKANAHIHRKNRHEVTIFGINVNKSCSIVVIEIIPPTL